jgi:Tol biopolymer transport system component
MKALFTAVLALALVMIAMPVFAEIGPEYGTMVNITFDKRPSTVIENIKLRPAISPDGKWIAFTTTVVDNGSLDGIWIVSSAGGTAELLYADTPFIDCLRFTPDGKVLTFQQTIITYNWELEKITTSTETIKAINLETREKSIVLENAGRAQWSKDGRYISFITYDPRAFTDVLHAEHNGVITIYDTQTGEKRYLTDENLSEDSLKYVDPTISPDMKWIYFNEMKSTDGISVSQLYRMPFEGGEKEQLTFFENVKSVECRNMNFSPDGKWILFDYTCDILVYNTENGVVYRYFSGISTTSPNSIPQQTGFENNPSWMSDGTSFVYSSYGDDVEIFICKFDMLKYPISDVQTLVESENPAEFAAINNYPNPFNPTTTISYSVSNPGHVSLNIYNISGQKTASLVNGFVSAGKHDITFDGSGLSSGIYFYRLETAKFSKMGRMMLLK